MHEMVDESVLAQVMKYAMLVYVHLDSIKIFGMSEGEPTKTFIGKKNSICMQNIIRKKSRHWKKGATVG